LGGKVAATLGEVKNRADLVIYWGANPAECHPWHFRRYSLRPKGRFIPNGRTDRTMVLVDVRPTLSVGDADIFLQVRPKKDFEILTSLRALVKGRSVDPQRLEATGVSLEELQELVALMKGCRFGVIFFGMGVTMTRGKYMNSSAILTLAAELNAFTKFVAMPMRGHGNVTGADSVVTWTTGYPFGVDFSRGYPRYNPGEFTACDLLARGEVDAVLVLGADPAATMPGPAADHLRRVPTIVLDCRYSTTSTVARVHVTTAPTGIGTSGTIYRMDEVPLPVRPVLTSPYPSDESVLADIRRAVDVQVPSTVG